MSSGKLACIMLIAFIVFAIIVAIVALRLRIRDIKPTEILGTIKVVTDTSDGQTYITVELNSYADLEMLKRSKSATFKVDSITVD